MKLNIVACNALVGLPGCLSADLIKEQLHRATDDLLGQVRDVPIDGSSEHVLLLG
jgi:hypothetical protein